MGMPTQCFTMCCTSSDAVLFAICMFILTGVLVGSVGANARRDGKIPSTWALLFDLRTTFSSCSGVENRTG